MQRAGLHEQEIRHQHAVLGDVLNAPNQVGVDGVDLLDHGRTRCRRLAGRHHYVDQIATETCIARGLDGDLDRRVLLLLAGHEDGDVAHQIGTRGFDVFDHQRQIGKGGREIVERRKHGAARHILIEILQLHAPHLVGLRHALEDGRQLLFQRFHLAALLGLHVGRQAGETLGLDHVAVEHGRKGETLRCAQDSDTLRLGLDVERFQRLLLAGLEAGLDATAARLVVIAFEDGRDNGPQLVERRDHALGERARAAGWQAQRARPVRFIEIVDVDPIVRRLAVFGLRRQLRLDGGALAGCGRAEHKDIVVVRMHLHAEFERFECAILTNQAGERIEFRCGLEAKLGRIDCSAQFRNGEGRRGQLGLCID